MMRKRQTPKKSIKIYLKKKNIVINPAAISSQSIYLNHFFRGLFDVKYIIIVIYNTPKKFLRW